jgi:hypothetical protein
MTTLSLRRLWTIYKQTAVAQGFGSSKRDLALSHVAFYSAARGRARRNGVGAPDDQKPGRQIKALRGARAASCSER